jgi:LysM repeat protein
MYCIEYVIKKGDSLYSISRHFNVSISSIMQANPLVNVYNLMVDETLCIPVSVPQNNVQNNTTYLIQEGDTLGSVMNKNGINMADLMMQNDANEVYLMPGTTLQVPIMGTGESGMTM